MIDQTEQKTDLPSQDPIREIDQILYNLYLEYSTQKEPDAKLLKKLIMGGQSVELFIKMRQSRKLVLGRGAADHENEEGGILPNIIAGLSRDVAQAIIDQLQPLSTNPELTGENFLIIGTKLSGVNIKASPSSRPNQDVKWSIGFVLDAERMKQILNPTNMHQSLFKDIPIKN